MGNIFKLDFSNANKISWQEVSVLGLAPLGQLYARVKYYNGSIDKEWMMAPIFLFPPLSFIPLVLMKLGMVKNGKGSNPIDYWILLPVLIKFLIPFIIVFTDNNNVIFWVLLLFQFMSIFIANFINMAKKCNEIKTETILKVFTDSCKSFGSGSLILFIIRFIPIIGTVISVLKMLPYIGKIVELLVWSVGFIGTYVIITMKNQEMDPRYLCSPVFTSSEKFSNYIYPILMLIIGIISEVLNR